MFDMEERALANVKERLDDFIAGTSNLGNDDKAFLMNQIGILYYGTGDYRRSTEYQGRAYELCPDDMHYTYNL